MYTDSTRTRRCAPSIIFMKRAQPLPLHFFFFFLSFPCPFSSLEDSGNPWVNVTFFFTQILFLLSSSLVWLALSLLVPLPAQYKINTHHLVPPQTAADPPRVETSRLFFLIWTPSTSSSSQPSSHFLTTRFNWNFPEWVRPLLAFAMEKETASPELNVYVSSPSGSRAKETTFREWVVDNQIGTLYKSMFSIAAKMSRLIELFVSLFCQFSSNWCLGSPVMKNSVRLTLLALRRRYLLDHSGHVVGFT